MEQVPGDREQESEFRSWEAKCFPRLCRDSHTVLAASCFVPSVYCLLPTASVRSQRCRDQGLGAGRPGLRLQGTGDRE